MEQRYAQRSRSHAPCLGFTQVSGQIDDSVAPGTQAEIRDMPGHRDAPTKGQWQLVAPVALGGGSRSKQRAFSLLAGVERMLDMTMASYGQKVQTSDCGALTIIVSAPHERLWTGQSMA
jgi:hypothetical protein